MGWKFRMESYYSEQELSNLGLKSFGRNVKISRFSRIYGAGNISIGSNVRIDDFCFLSAGGSIEIGSHIHISPFCLFSGQGKIVLEDFSGLSSRVSLYSSTDDYSGAALTNPTVNSKFTNVKTGNIHLGRHAIIGAGAVVLPDVTLEEGCAVAALALVRNSFPAWSIIVGNPARRAAERSKDLLKIEDSYLKWLESQR